MGFKVFLVVVLNNGAPKTQISLASQEVSQELWVWFYRPSSVTEKNLLLPTTHCGQRQIITASGPQ